MTTLNNFCIKHGGDGSIHEGDSFFLCPICSTDGIEKCKCGGQPQYFGEALMSSVSCPSCKAFVGGVGVKARELWNNGVRGSVKGPYDD